MTIDGPGAEVASAIPLADPQPEAVLEEANPEEAIKEAEDILTPPLPHKNILVQASFTSQELASQIEGVQDATVNIEASEGLLILESRMDKKPAASLTHVSRAMEVIVIPAIERTLDHKITEKTIHYQVAEETREAS